MKLSYYKWVSSASQGEGVKLLKVTKHKSKTPNNQSLGVVPGKEDKFSGSEDIDALAPSLAVSFQ